MQTIDVIREFASRPVLAVRGFPALTTEQLNARPGDHPNSIAWLLWHSARQVDTQLAALTAAEQVWTREGFRERFALGPAGDHDGIYHTAEEAQAIVVENFELLGDYLEATLDAIVDYWAGLSTEDLEVVIDVWDGEDITRGVRLISLIDDTQQHVGTANHIAGILLQKPAGLF